MSVLRTAFLAIVFTAVAIVTVRADEFIPPAPVHYVTDNANVLSPSTQSSIENELRDYEKTTGHQVIVWIGETTGDTELEQWTVDAAQKWKVGRKGEDDGAVLFAFMRDHKLRIEVGYGLEPSLTDAQANGIISNIITPKMRAEDYDAAIQNGVDAMLVTITPSFASHIGHEIATPEPAEDGNGNPIGFFIVFGFILLFVFFIVFVRSLQYFFIMLFQGPAAAHKMWHTAWITSGASFGGWSSGSSGGDFGGFSGGGGSFGGGGASGSW